jgi:hypothetical protein
MAYTFMSVGPKSQFKKRLFINDDGSVSDTVYIEGVIANLNIDLDAEDLGVVGGHMQVDVVSTPALVDVVRVSHRVAITASQTGATVWTPATGNKFVLAKLIVSAKTAGDVEFFDSTDSGNTVIGPIVSLNIGGGWSEMWQKDNPYRSAAGNNVLKYTSGIGITGSIYVEGWEEAT